MPQVPQWHDATALVISDIFTFSKQTSVSHRSKHMAAFLSCRQMFYNGHKTRLTTNRSRRSFTEHKSSEAKGQWQQETNHDRTVNYLDMSCQELINGHDFALYNCLFVLYIHCLNAPFCYTTVVNIDGYIQRLYLTVKHYL